VPEAPRAERRSTAAVPTAARACRWDNGPRFWAAGRDITRLQRARVSDLAVLPYPSGGSLNPPDGGACAR
jgi:hypothetical protein